MTTADNPLKVIACKWYGRELTDARARKLDRLWRKLADAAVKPAQSDLFADNETKGN